MAKCNMSINKSLAKEVENEKTVQTLPLIEFGGGMYPIFTPISPSHCSICRNPIKPNEHYGRCICSWHYFDSTMRN